MHDNFKDTDNVIIPDAHLDYCRDSVLVMDFIEGTQIKDLSNVDQNTKSRYSDLIGSSYLKQVYLDGFYHADPHGGNIIVKGDSIAFIDFGAVGTIDDELKKNMLKLFYSVYNKDVDTATESFLKIAGLTQDDVNIRRFKKDIDDLISDMHYGNREHKSDRYASLALKYDLSLPGEFSTLEKAILLIESVCSKLDPGYNIIYEAEPLLNKAMKERYSSDNLMKTLQLETDEYMEIFKNLPEGIDDVIKTIRGYHLDRLQRRGDFTKKYQLLGNFSKYTFLGILIAASTYLMVESRFTVIGTIGFTCGLLLGMYMLLRL
jgi:ubiquinone biosynthesis protein